MLAGCAFANSTYFAKRMPAAFRVNARKTIRFNGITQKGLLFHLALRLSSNKKTKMFNPILVKIVNACTRHAWPVIAAALLVTIVCGVYAIRNFAINTDIEALISPELPWRQREIAFNKAFPNRYDRILVVVDAPTSELASQAANALVERLSGHRELFHSLRQLGRGDEFFARNGILFLSVEEVQRMAEQLDQGSPLITLLVTDPSLRGLAESLSLGLTGLQRGQLELDKMVWALKASWPAVRPTSRGTHTPTAAPRNRANCGV